MTDNNEVKDMLENETGDFAQDDMYQQQWQKAHEEYDNGNTDMLEHMVNGLHNTHALKVLKDYKGGFSKKGKYLDYDEWHSFSASAGLVGLSYVWHPIALALWVYVTKQIFDHSHKDVKEAKCKHWMETLDVFGKELWYYIGGGLVSAWFFTEFTQYGLALEDAGTLATIGLEASKLLLGQ